MNVNIFQIFSAYLYISNPRKNAFLFTNVMHSCYIIILRFFHSYQCYKYGLYHKILHAWDPFQALQLSNNRICNIMIHIIQSLFHLAHVYNIKQKKTHFLAVGHPRIKHNYNSQIKTVRGLSSYFSPKKRGQYQVSKTILLKVFLNTL